MVTVTFPSNWSWWKRTKFIRDHQLRIKETRTNIHGKVAIVI